MGTYKRTEGQTIIETALMLVLLLLILFGITEFSRAWYTKNSLKNAVRHGARVAVVTDGITEVDPSAPNCPSADAVINAVCTSFCTSSSPDECYSRTTVSLDTTDDDGSGGLNAGDTIIVSASTDFLTVVPNIMGSFIPSTLSADASMRYE